MRCAVSVCKNNSARKALNISFFKFPTNETVRRHWINFCRRGKSFRLRNDHICMDHFKSSDFENELKYEMGFTKKRILKRGAIPTIYKMSEKKTTNIAKRLEELSNEKRENEHILKTLLQKYHDLNAVCEQTLSDNVSSVTPATLKSTVPSASKQLFVYNILYDLTLQLIQESVSTGSGNAAS